MSGDPIVTALLSYGMSGEVFHGPLLAASPAFRLKRIAERHASRSRERYPESTPTKAVKEVLDDPEVELIVVNTPNDSHFALALEALQAGKHVILEKPFTVTVEEGRRLIEVAAEAKKMLTVFQNRRWDSDFMTVQKVVNEGRLGRIVEAELHYDRYRSVVQLDTWKEEPVRGSGILYNLGSHMLDQALVLFGMPDLIDARTGARREGSKVDDFYDIRLTYSDKLVIAKSGYLVCADMPRYILHGTDGSFVKYGLDPQEEALKAGKKPGSAKWGEEDKKFRGTLTLATGDERREERIESLPGNYLSFYENVYEVLRHGKPAAVRPEEALDGILLITLALESARGRCAKEVRLL